MKPISKVAVFLMLIGMEKGQRIFELMDNDEIKVVVSEIRSLTTVSAELQASIWTEFENLGYNEEMKSSDILTMIRFLFKGSKMSDFKFRGN